MPFVEHLASRGLSSSFGKQTAWDIPRREAADLAPHPLQLTDDEDDLWAVQARRENVLLGSPPFSAPIVSVTGRMARMTTISPTAFVDFKRWMASTADRDPPKVTYSLPVSRRTQNL
ncbi:GSU2403 family nucleotidyltransferase fold protein [Cupriavidus necator]